ncbi:NTP transferase domain-containing protein [Granulicella sp. S156]|jgi:molybdenum cofactor cytidylyltransferase|uniref:nucleotidyltransferase family protein n=1 Tax=Granulicella sp. S156 TaxID=1747224 RepID=UPI00131E69E4|nr:nucleotidyltransferase family protein [Granulicella sp. S156]
MSIAGVVLAAGTSSRLGRPKQTVVFEGETLVERAVRVAQEAGLSPVIAVVNPEGDFGHSLQQLGCLVVINEGFAEGMAASIRRGVAVAKMLKASGVVLMTCDQVAVSPEHLRALYEDTENIAGSGYAGKVGIPAYFPTSGFDDLQQLSGDVGAREMLRSARVVVDERLALDIDTEEDLTRAEATTNAIAPSAKPPRPLR